MVQVLFPPPPPPKKKKKKKKKKKCLTLYSMDTHFDASTTDSF